MLGVNFIYAICVDDLHRFDNDIFSLHCCMSSSKKKNIIMRPNG